MHARGASARGVPTCPAARDGAILLHTVHRTVTNNLLSNGVDLGTVHTLLNHANVHTTAQYAQCGERAKKQAVGTLHVPYRRRKG